MLRKLQLSEFDALYREHIDKDFPREERPPLFIMKRQMKKGVYDGLIYFDEPDDTLQGSEDLAYSLCIDSHDSGFVLIFLYAVMSGRRGKGIGSGFMRELAEHYQKRDGLIVEVEKPEDACDEAEREIRERRITFYERLGYVLIPEVDYSIFGVPMYLMVLPLAGQIPAPGELVNIIKTIYKKSPGAVLTASVKN